MFETMLSQTGASETGADGFLYDPAAGRGSGDERGVRFIPGVNGVGATFWANSAAFGQMPSFDGSFTDVGPGAIYDDSIGGPYAAPKSAGKLDVDAPDGVPVVDVPEPADSLLRNRGGSPPRRATGGDGSRGPARVSRCSASGPGLRSACASSVRRHAGARSRPLHDPGDRAASGLLMTEIPGEGRRSAA